MADHRYLQNGRHVFFDGVDQGQYANGVNSVTWGDSLLMTGTFVADGTGSQSFTVQTTTPNGVTLAGGQLNAVLVYAVPEPSAVALLGLPGLCLVPASPESEESHPLKGHPAEEASPVRGRSAVMPVTSATASHDLPCVRVACAAAAMRSPKGNLQIE